MRVRCSRGLRVSSFHGPMFVRSTDLLALPQVCTPHCPLQWLCCPDSRISGLRCRQHEHELDMCAATVCFN